MAPSVSDYRVVLRDIDAINAVAGLVNLTGTFQLRKSSIPKGHGYPNNVAAPIPSKTLSADPDVTDKAVEEIMKILAE